LAAGTPRPQEKVVWEDAVQALFFLTLYSVLNTGGCHQQTCALRAPTVFSGRIKTIRPENTVMDKSKNDMGSFLSKMRKPEADAERDSSRHV
jgi:hypothetical protein